MTTPEDLLPESILDAARRCGVQLAEQLVARDVSGISDEELARYEVEARSICREQGFPIGASDAFMVTFLTAAKARLRELIAAGADAQGSA